MHSYVVKRLLLMIPTLFGVSIVVWGVTAAAPEPPLDQRMPGIESGKKAGEASTMNEALKAYRAQFGLDKPALLNFFYDLEVDEVRRAVIEARTGGEGTDEEKISRRLDARESLVNWGYYAVPALVEVVRSAGGVDRDQAVKWLGNNATRVTRVDPGHAVDEKTATENSIITAEKKLLEALAWAADAPEEEKEQKIRAIGAWYEGAASAYPESDPEDQVIDALVAGKPLGERAVPVLARLVIDATQHAAPAARALRRAAARDGDEVHNGVVAMLGWPDGAPASKRRAGIVAAGEWWNGSRHRWDYGGAAWIRVMMLETQFASYWRNLLTFDLGYSSVHKEPVLDLITRRLKYSLTLSVSSMLLAFLIAVPLGLYSARTHGLIRERILSVIVFILYSMPSFFVATILLRFLARGQAGSLEVIPTGGFESPDAWSYVTWDRVKDIAWHIVTPIFCMTYASLAALSRYAKTGLLNVIRSDYVRTARAKGLSDFIVTYKHAARPGIIPVITLIGGTLPVVVSGSFIIEFIFQIPGFGLLMVESVKNNDYNVIVGILLIVAVLTMIGILLSDLLYAIADPRISLS